MADFLRLSKRETRRFFNPCTTFSLCIMGWRKFPSFSSGGQPFISCLSSCLHSYNQGVYTDWQCPLSGAQSIMRVKSAQAGEGGEFVHVKSCSVRSSWEGRYTPPISPLPLYVLCGYNLQAARLGLIIYNYYLIISSSSRHIKSQLWKQKSVWHCCPLAMFHCWMEVWGHRKNNESWK